jgi:hypothetical protein
MSSWVLCRGQGDRGLQLTTHFHRFEVKNELICNSIFHLCFRHLERDIFGFTLPSWCLRITGKNRFVWTVKYCINEYTRHFIGFLLVCVCFFCVYVIGKFVAARGLDVWRHKIRWASRSVRFTLHKKTPVPLKRRLGAPQSGSGRFGEERWINLLTLPRIEPWFHGSPARSLVTVLTELSQLLYVCVCVCARAHARRHTPHKYMSVTFFKKIHRTSRKVYFLAVVLFDHFTMKSCKMFTSFSFITCLSARSMSQNRRTNL